MILHSIRVSGWRSFLEAVEVGPFAEGLNVIHAPNGTGKSTLFEALRRGLLDSHGVTGQEIKAIQPWGRSLPPRVCVEFSHEGTSYRITKQFIEDTLAEAERKEDGRFRRWASGRQADDEIRDMLTSNPPGRGLSQPKNWGFAQALWAPQGDLVLSDFSDDLVANIREALGVQLSDASGGPIEACIAALYEGFYTPGGRLRSGAGAPELVQLTDRLEKVMETRRDARERLNAYEEASRKVEDLRAKGEQAHLEAEELAKQIQQIRASAEQYRDLQNQAERKRSTADAAEARVNELQSKIDAIRKTEAELKEAQAELTSLSADTGAKQREVETREKAFEDARIALERLEQERPSIEKAKAQAEAAHRFVSAREELDKLDQRIERIEAAQSALDEAKDAQAAVLAPDRKQLNAIRKAIEERDKAQGLIDASLISLDITPSKDAHLEILMGDETGERDLSAGKTSTFKGSPEVVAEIAGVGRFRASGPAGDIQEHRDSLAKAEKRIQKLTGAFGTTDYDALEALSSKADDLEGRVNEKQTQLTTLLDDDTLDALKQDRTAAQAVVSRLLAENPEWEQTPPKPDTMAAKASERQRTLDAKLADARGARERAQEALSTARGQQQSHDATLKERESTVRRQEDRLAEETKDGKTLDEREKSLAEFRMTWQASRDGLAEIEKQFEAFDEDPTAILGKLEKQIRASQDASQKAREDVVAAEARLESLAAQGPYTAMVAAEEEYEQLKERVASEQLRADAVKLLYDTIETCRSEAVAAVADPVEKMASRYLQRIAGRRIGNVQLGEKLLPSTVLPDAIENTVEIANLSGGEREQLYLSTRLALAEVLSKEERQLVVLDDVLTATDTSRLARIMGILEEAAQRLQILILTCHPERYRSLEDAVFHDLEALITEQSA